METETILRAVENGKLNDAREGIDEVLLNKIADALEEKRQGLGDTLVGVCEDCDEAEEVEEGNEFSKALRTARKEGKSTFTVDGKEYTVEDYDDDDEELSEEDTKYQKFFRKALEKFNVSSPADFKSEEEKKKFFDYVDKNYKADKEED
tara:strand:- start:1020 stop:1466 length:447 start_codon:yes stop_codon:yes gene_type:complete